MKILVSGAAGFIGGGIARAAVTAGHEVFGGLRNPAPLPPGVTPLVTGDLADNAPSLACMDVVIHAAGLGHRRGGTTAIWRRANLDAAVRLAEAAADADVRRFVLISTAYVLGRVARGRVTDDSPPNPMDDYAKSKLAAEAALKNILGDRLVVLRPAAVIGPGAPGNLRLLIALLRRGVKLPFGSIRNARGFVDRDDLADLILLAAMATAPPPVILAANPQPVSTPALIRALADGLGVAARLFPCPAPLLAALAAAAGRRAMWQSLAGDFAAVPAAALALGWRPGDPFAQLAETARYYVTTNTVP